MKISQKPRVVIVEDEVLIAELIVGFLSDLGFPVTGRFRYGKESIEQIQSVRPDVIIMDIRLPDMDGIKVVAEIQKVYPVPVVMLTAFDDADLVERATAAGAGAYIIKPTEAKELERAILVSIARFEDLNKHRMLSEQLKQEIHERKEAESRLKEINYFLNFIIDHASTWFVFFNASKEIEIWNEAADQITGYSKNDIRKHPELLDKIFYQEDVDTVLFGQTSAVGRECTTDNREITIRNKSGENRILSFISKCVEENGSRIGYVSIAIDMTKMKLAELAYLESEERLHILIESTEDIVTLHDLSGKYLYYNGPSSFPMQADDVVGKSPKTVFGVKTGTKIIEHIKQVARTGKHLTVDNHIVWNRESFWFSDHIFPIRDEYENTNRIAVFSRNITERKRVEEALRESELQYRTLFESAREAIITFDAKGQILSANSAAAKMLGYLSPQEILMMPFRSVFFLPEQYGLLIKELKENGFVERFEIALKSQNRDQPRIDVLGSMTLQKNVNEKITHYEAILSDITDRKRTEVALRESQELLRNYSAHLQNAREQERAHMAREIHDELGQALTALKMDLSWLGKRLTQSDRSLQKKAESMNALIDQNIQMVKHLTSELRPGLLDDLGLTAAIEWQAEEFVKRTGLICNLKIDPEEMEIPEEISTVVFRIFQEAMTNVMRHAKATRVEACLSKNGAGIKLRIKDNGIGITQAQIQDPRAFGLIGMRERVEFLGGTIQIEGVPNLGTTLELILPYA